MSTYDVAQICMNGHVINSYCLESPQFSHDFCKDCGSKTTKECIDCKKPIRGSYSEGYSLKEFPTPRYCEYCGSPYPWTLARFEAVKELIDIAPTLSSEQRQELKNLLPDIANQTPRSDVAALKFGKIAEKAKDFGKRIIEKVAVDVASEPAKIALIALIKETFS